VARENSVIFDRLGADGEAAFLIVPTGSALAFRLGPAAGPGGVTMVRPDDPQPVTATIRGPLVELVSLFAGVYDDDATVFGRRIEVEGGAGAVLALHNLVEAAELGLRDLLAAPTRLRSPLNAGLAVLLSLARLGPTAGTWDGRRG
jgi:predicted lipid carrier protein YhbT